MPPARTQASSPIPTSTPRRASPATAAIAATRSSSDSMARNVPRAVRLPVYHPARRRLNAYADSRPCRSRASAVAGAFFVGGAPMPITVAYPGEEGAYAAEAGARLYPDAELRSCKSWADVVRAVGRGEAGYGVLPIENSLAGAIPETYDLLAHAPLAIVAETVLPVPHCLVGLPGDEHRRARPGALPPGGAGPVPPLPLVAARHAARGGAVDRDRRPPGGRGGRPAARPPSRRGGRPRGSA